MAKILRATQLQFASAAGTNQLAKFGSLAAGSPVRYTGATVTPANIQALSNYLSGWFGAVLGGNSPAIEDMNALCYLFAYQLGYILQTGVPEYDSATTYFIGSMVTSGSLIYVSLTDTNLGNAVTSTTNWALYGNRVRTVTTTTTIGLTDNMLRADPTSGAFTSTLPPVATTPIGFRVTYKNVATNGNQSTLKGNAAELIDQANTIVLDSSPVNDSVTVSNNGTGWDII